MSPLSGRTGEMPDDRVCLRVHDDESAPAGARRPEGAMMMTAGLLAACLGGLLLALSAHLRGVSGFVVAAVFMATPPPAGPSSCLRRTYPRPR